MTPSNKPVRDQYHHFIPRFIIRRFQVDTGPPKTGKERQREFRRAKKNPSLTTDKVLLYGVATGVLDSHLVSKVYGETNLYKDDNVTMDVNHIEEKFSRLENDAAFFVNHLHNTISGSGNIVIKRRDLGMFRKFLFLMHYRSGTSYLTYFKEDHPENVPIRDWIKKRKKDKGLKNDTDVWLDGIQYHLENPHHLIVAEAEVITKRLGGAMKVEMMKMTRVDPNVNWHALEYESVANGHFMGIWEAADGAEFIIGSNSFGLWEGMIMGVPHIHRIYILSPRLVVILRNHQSPMLPFGISSNLIDIRMDRPVPHYARFKPNPKSGKEPSTQLAEYRITDAAQEDTYTFKITKLTKAQTQAVNNVVLLNINDGGSITFASRSCMLSTLQAYFKSNDPFIKRSRRIYDSLLKELSTATSNTGTNQSPLLSSATATASPISSSSSSTGSDPTLSLSTATTTASPISVPPSDKVATPPATAKSKPEEPFADSNLHLIIQAIVDGILDFPSGYERAYYIYHTATDDPSMRNAFSEAIRGVTSESIMQFSRLNPQPPPTNSHRPHPGAQLVEKIPRDKAPFVLAHLRRIRDLLGISPNGSDGEEENTTISKTSTLICDASTIGWLEWLAKNRQDVLENLGFRCRMLK